MQDISANIEPRELTMIKARTGTTAKYYQGWFERKCRICGIKTKERVLHNSMIRPYGGDFPSFREKKIIVHHMCHDTGTLLNDVETLFRRKHKS